MSAPRSPAPSAEELAIVRLLAQGLTDDAVAQRLDLAKRTYRRRLDGVLSKLGARSRFQAGAVAAQRSWLTGSVGREGDLFWPRVEEGAMPEEEELSRRQDRSEHGIHLRGDRAEPG